jgi:hypothetical protein
VSGTSLDFVLSVFDPAFWYVDHVLGYTKKNFRIRPRAIEISPMADCKIISGVLKLRFTTSSKLVKAEPQLIR